MADSHDKAVKSAEEAYAAAAAAPARSEFATAEAAPVIIDQPVTDEASVRAPAKGAAPRNAKPATKKPASTKRRTISKPRRVPAPKAARTPAKATTPAITELKDTIMATAKTTDFTKPFTDAIGDAQTKAKAAYDKGAELAAEATEFAKGNVEALVESGKIYAAGVQTLGKAYADEARTAYETLTADLKELAAVKSPAELFQLQAKLARRNFDAMVAYGSKNTDAAIKLAGESFAPISGRISLAAEKVAKAA
jgi:phasin family protein